MSLLVILNSSSAVVATAEKAEMLLHHCHNTLPVHPADYNGSPMQEQLVCFSGV